MGYRRRNFERFLYVGLALAAVAGCAAPLDGAEPGDDPGVADGALAPKIWRGVPITAPTSLQQKIVGLNWKCSGVLINPSTILTAAHCVKNASTTTVPSMNVACSVQWLDANGQLHDEESNDCWMWRNAGWNGSLDNSDAKDDFGLVNMPFDMAPTGGLTLYSGSMSGGDRLALFGWGVTGDGWPPIWLHRDPEFDTLGITELLSTLIKADADIRVVRSCDGDSGAPWIRASNPGLHSVAGIHTGSDDSVDRCTAYGATMTATRIRTGMINWINARIVPYTGKTCFQTTATSNIWRCF